MKMPDIVKLLFVGTGTLAVICWGGCTQNDGSRKAATQSVKTSEVATQFVKIAEIHVVFAQSYAAGYRDEALNHASSEKEINCVMTEITPELMLPVLATAFAMKCSDDELQQAISFYESDTGKTYMRTERMRVKAMLGMSTEVPPEYSPSDEERIVTFEQTRVGKLVTTQDDGLRAVVREATQPQLVSIFKQCKNAQ